MYLINRNIYLAQRYFVWIKQILFNSSESLVNIKKRLSKKSFSFIQSNLFSQCGSANQNFSPPPFLADIYFSKILFSLIYILENSWLIQKKFVAVTKIFFVKFLWFKQNFFESNKFVLCYLVRKKFLWFKEISWLFFFSLN